MVSKDLNERRLQTIIEAVHGSRRRQIILENIVIPLRFTDLILVSS